MYLRKRSGDGDEVDDVKGPARLGIFPVKPSLCYEMGGVRVNDMMRAPFLFSFQIRRISLEKGVISIMALPHPTPRPLNPYLG